MRRIILHMPETGGVAVQRPLNIPHYEISKMGTENEGIPCHHFRFAIIPRVCRGLQASQIIRRHIGGHNEIVRDGRNRSQRSEA
jgi:hypothetical protein